MLKLNRVINTYVTECVVAKAIYRRMGLHSKGTHHAKPSNLHRGEVISGSGNSAVCIP